MNNDHDSYGGREEEEYTKMYEAFPTRFKWFCFAVLFLMSLFGLYYEYWKG